MRKPILFKFVVEGTIQIEARDVIRARKTLDTLAPEDIVYMGEVTKVNVETRVGSGEVEQIPYTGHRQKQSLWRRIFR